MSSSGLAAGSGNDIHDNAMDCADSSSGSGTSGTANTWIGNIGGISFPPGICRPPAP